MFSGKSKSPKLEQLDTLLRNLNVAKIQVCQTGGASS